MNKTVAVIGAKGWVGKAMLSIFPEAVAYDIDQSTRDEVNACDVAFICVPTNALPDGSLDVSIVHTVVRWCECPLIVIRSTVNPGTWRSLEGHQKNILIQPEYLGETTAHPLFNEGDRQFLVIGGSPNNRRKLIELYQTVYNANVTIRQVTAKQAEIIKLTENRAIAFKVMQCHELYKVCQAAEEDYYLIREAVYGDDPRFNLYWTFVYPGNLGFDSSKCLVKDVPAWAAWAESLGADASLTRKLIEKSSEWSR